MRCLPRHFLSRRAKDPRGIETGSEAAKPATGHAGHCTRVGMYAPRKGEHGSAILESFFSMILLGMILFGILQLFQLAVADMITDYAAFRGARSAAVGFNERLTRNEALVKAVPASGSMVFPDPRTYAGYQFNSVETEKALLRSFQEAKMTVEYANWNGEERFHMNYKCPYYGELLLSDCPICSRSKQSHVKTRLQPYEKEVVFQFEFLNYPLNIPLHDWLTGRDSIDISGEAELTNHSSAYLE